MVRDQRVQSYALRYSLHVSHQITLQPWAVVGAVGKAEESVYNCFWDSSVNIRGRSHGSVSQYSDSATKLSAENSVVLLGYRTRKLKNVLLRLSDLLERVTGRRFSVRGREGSLVWRADFAHCLDCTFGNSGMHRHCYSRTCSRHVYFPNQHCFPRKTPTIVNL